MKSLRFRINSLALLGIYAECSWLIRRAVGASHASRSCSSLSKSHVAAVESGEIIDIIDQTTDRTQWLHWLNTEGQPVSAEGSFCGWHPNGYEFLFREDNAPDHGLWLVDARSGEHRLIAQQPTWDISGAAISPDGQRLIYATNTFDMHQIWTANADSSEPRLLLESDVIVYVYSWSPDGRYLLYAGEPSVTAADSGGPLWVMDREGQDRKR